MSVCVPRHIVCLTYIPDFIAGSPPCTLQVLNERKSRLETGGTLFRSVKVGTLTNNISISCEWQDSSGFQTSIPADVAQVEVTIVDGTTIEIYNASQSYNGTSWTVSAIPDLRAQINTTSPSATSPSLLIQMPTFDTTEQFVPPVDIEALVDADHLAEFATTKLSGGTGAPEITGLPGLRTGPFFSLVLIDSSEINNDDGKFDNVDTPRYWGQVDGSPITLDWLSFTPTGDCLDPSDPNNVIIVGSGSPPLIYECGTPYRPAFNQDLLNRIDEENTVVSFSSAATDPNGYSIIYGGTNLPIGVSINATTGLISGTLPLLGSPTINLYDVLITADNGKGGVANDTFTWSIAIVYYGWFSTLTGGIDEDAGYDIAIDHTGDYFYMIGRTINQGAGLYDVLFAKYDLNGIAQWQKTIGTADHEFNGAYKGVIVDPATGSVYISGSGGYHTPTDTRHGILYKYDSSGNLIWQKKITGSPPLYIGECTMDTSGNIYVTGIIWSGLWDIVVIKFNSSGTIQWSRKLASPGSAYESLGSVKAYGTDLYVTGTTEIGSNGDKDQWLARITQDSGALVWQRRIGRPETTQIYREYARTGDIDLSGNFYYSGYTADGDEGGYDAILTKYNSSGVLQWQQMLGGLGNDLLTNVTVHPDTGDVYAVGITQSFKTVPDSVYNILIVKYNQDGILQWQRTLGTVGGTIAEEILFTGTDSMILVGNYITSNGASDVLVVKLPINGNADVIYDVDGSYMSYADGTLLSYPAPPSFIDQAGDFTSSAVTMSATNGTATSSVSTLVEYNTPLIEVPVQYYFAVITSSPIAYWRLGETDTTGTAVDEIGTYDGTYINSPFVVTGLLPNGLNTAVQGNDVDKYISLPNSLHNVVGNGNTTIEALVQINPNYVPIISRGLVNTAGIEYGMACYLSASGIVMDFRVGTSVLNRLIYSYTFVSGVTYHLVMTRNITSGELEVYVNGSSVMTHAGESGEVIYHPTYDVGFSSLAIRRNLSDSYGDGTIDELAVYNRIISPVEVLEHFTATGL